MPIYEYRCSECGEKFEKLVRLSTATSEIECPKCGGQKVEKLLSLFSARTSSATAVASAAACSTPT
jgi:putative FmdB family regulatory protein